MSKLLLYSEVATNSQKALFNLNEKFSKILVGIDGSKPSMDAVDYAITLAQKINAQLITLYATSSPVGNDYTSDTPGDQIPGTATEFVYWAKEESRPWFAEIDDKVKASANAATAKENTGETVRAIIQLKTLIIVSPLSVIGSIIGYAERENIDLIVVGTRGKSGFKRLLLGSIASGVVTHAHCPVLVVK